MSLFKHNLIGGFFKTRFRCAPTLAVLELVL